MPGPRCLDPPCAQNDDAPAGHFTKSLSWMIGSSTDSTIMSTTAPIATISIGSRRVASANARRWTSLLS
jgi:hypothetical protein